MSPELRRNSHVVPRFFLRQFADSAGLLRMFDKSDGSERIVPANKAMVSRDFYTTSVSNAPDDTTERVLAEHEGRAAGALQRINKRFPPDAADREAIAIFVALQFARTRPPRDAIDGFVTELAQRVADLVGRDEFGVRAAWDQVSDRPPTAEDLRAFGDALRSRTLRVRLPTDEHVGNMWAVAEGLANILTSRSWLLIESEELFTSDFPVIFWKTNQIPGIGVGPGNADELLMPISPSQALLLAREGLGTERTIKMPHHMLEQPLRQLWYAADRFTFRHPDSRWLPPDPMRRHTWGAGDRAD